jgi:hypothetical protein
MARGIATRALAGGHGVTQPGEPGLLATGREMDGPNENEVSHCTSLCAATADNLRSRAD